MSMNVSGEININTGNGNDNGDLFRNAVNTFFDSLEKEMGEVDSDCIMSEPGEAAEGMDVTMHKPVGEDKYDAEFLKRMANLFINEDIILVNDSDSEDEDCSNKENVCSIPRCHSQKNVALRSRFASSLYNFSDSVKMCDDCFQKLEEYYTKVINNTDISDDGRFHLMREPSHGISDKSTVEISKDMVDCSGPVQMNINSLSNFTFENLSKLCVDTIENENLMQHLKNRETKYTEKIYQVYERAEKFLSNVEEQNEEFTKTLQDFYATFRFDTEDTGVVDMGFIDVDRPFEDCTFDKDIYQVLDDPQVCEAERVVKPVSLPPRGKLERPRPIVGQTVYIMTESHNKISSIGEWQPGVIEAIKVHTPKRNSEVATLSYTYKVRLVGSSKDMKEVSLAQMAYYNLCESRIPFGVRVIAVYHNPIPGQTDQPRRFFSGVTAETPTSNNQYRYMIFFDNGSVQYSSHEDMRVICHERQSMAEYFQEDFQYFYKHYFQGVSLTHKKLLPSFNTMDLIKIYFRGRWRDARVVALDGSLIQVFFPIEYTKEWLYRGFPWIMSVNDFLKEKVPLTKPYSPKNKEKFSVASPSASRQMVPSPSSGGGECSSRPSLAGRAKARKSTARVAHKFVPILSNQENNQPVLRTPKVEYAGNLVRTSVPEMVFPKPWKVHNCSNECINWLPYEDHKTKNRNPLLVPLIFAFRRVEECQLGSTSKSVHYVAPCGRVLADYEDLHLYLLTVQSELAIDFFNFDPWVQIYDEFKAPPASVMIKDLSYGKEETVIPVVNSVDGSVPQYMEYMTKRRPRKGVPLDLDQGFLTCCDCDNDCSDKVKCACWQLTLGGYFDLLQACNTSTKDMAATDPNLIGYQNRRLMENVPSGIFECNPKCRCKRTCLNKVVQNPMKVKLELFKTKLKGWGTRCLHDIPAGGFLCVYVGDILTESAANEGGKQYGDEYFAELDYIEVVSEMKPGYESNAEEDSDDEGKHRKSGREMFGKDEDVYIMDAKTAGNIGRYFNHSCQPNIFVQNVFVDSHDLRFPWVAFFAKSYIRAGSELTWDYQYVVDSVPGRAVTCHCQAPNCRGRLL